MRALADDRADQSAILNAECQRQAHVAELIKNPVGLRQMLVARIAPALVAAGKGDRLFGPEPFQLDAALLASSQEVQHLGLAECGREELEGAGDKAFGGGPLRDDNSGRIGKGVGNGMIALVPAPAIGVKHSKLRSQNRGPQIVHPARAIGRVEANVPENRFRRPRFVAAIKHVGA